MLVWTMPLAAHKEGSKMRNTCILLLTILCFFGAGASATQYRATSIDIDTNNGYQFFELNAKGQALFAVRGSMLLWSEATGSVQIPGPFLGLGLADNGDIVGCSVVSDGGDTCEHAIIYKASTGEIVELLLPAGTLRSQAWSVNDAGQIAGVVGLADGAHPVLWSTDGTPTILDATSGLSIDNIRINRDGEVMWNAKRVEDGYAPTDYRVLTWSESDGLATLPYFADSDAAGAVAMNDLGQILGYSGNHVVVWNSDGTITDLGSETADNFMYVYDINNKGQIVGYRDMMATVWNLRGGSSPIAGYGSSAYSINDSGQICGLWNSQTTLWTPVPEPSSLLALLASVGGLAVALRRRKQ
jgi:uncharacterized membrane protein